MDLCDTLIIGGDLRNVYLYNMLKKRGLSPRACGLDSFSGGIPKPRSLKRLSLAIERSRVIIGPTPMMNGGGLINAPFSKQPIEAGYLIERMDERHMFFAGRIRPDIAKALKTRGIAAYDILELEEMRRLNAIPTAEGAAAIAIENTPRTLRGANALILGSGAVGSALVDTLLCLGASVTAAARKGPDRERVSQTGAKAIPFNSLSDIIASQDVIFNTVPSVVLGKSLLRKVARDALYVELASKPYGFDQKSAEELGVNVIYAPSLPGKIAPMSAADYQLQTIERILKEARP